MAAHLSRLVAVIAAVVCLIVPDAAAVTHLVTALQFGAATSDRVAVPSTTATSQLSTWSVLALVQVTTLTGNRMIIGKGATAASNSRVEIRLQSAGTGDLQTVISHSTTSLNYRSTSTPLATLNKWVWIAAVCDLSLGAGQRVKFYASKTVTDGLAVQTVSVPNEPVGTPANDTGQAFTIGNNSGNAAAFQGRIAYVAFSNAALTVGDLDRIRRTWWTGRFTGALGAWVVGANGTGTVVDVTGNNNHGTITGATVANAQLPVFRQPAWR